MCEWVRILCRMICWCCCNSESKSCVSYTESFVSVTNNSILFNLVDTFTTNVCLSEYCISLNIRPTVMFGWWHILFIFERYEVRLFVIRLRLQELCLNFLTSSMKMFGDCMKTTLGYFILHSFSFCAFYNFNIIQHCITYVV